MTQGSVHPTASVAADAALGEGVTVWDWSKVREGAVIGAGTTLGQGVYVDHDVTIGVGCKVQNGVSIYHGVHIGDHVFVGPHVVFTNDLSPRASSVAWTVSETHVDDMASIGANATIVCGTRLGRGCLVGAGSVVTCDVPAFALVLGNPARIVDYVAADGSRLHVGPEGMSPDAGGQADA